MFIVYILSAIVLVCAVATSMLDIVVVRKSVNGRFTKAITPEVPSGNSNKS